MRANSFTSRRDSSYLRDEGENLDLVSLMLLDLLPQLGILLNTDLLRLVVDKLVQATEIHILGQQGDNVLVKSLPVRVLEVILLTLLFLSAR
jgi:hypothetical protein